MPSMGGGGRTESVAEDAMLTSGCWCVLKDEASNAVPMHISNRYFIVHVLGSKQKLVKRHEI